MKKSLSVIAGVIGLILINLFPVQKANADYVKPHWMIVERQCWDGIGTQKQCKFGYEGWKECNPKIDFPRTCNPEIANPN